MYQMGNRPTPCQAWDPFMALCHPTTLTEESLHLRSTPKQIAQMGVMHLTMTTSHRHGGILTSTNSRLYTADMLIGLNSFKLKFKRTVLADAKGFTQFLYQPPQGHPYPELLYFNKTVVAIQPPCSMACTPAAPHPSTMSSVRSWARPHQP